MYPDDGKIKQKRILLVHLVSLGDCLYATAIARQIKQDFPGCHLTWAISSRCSQIVWNNPCIDEIWEIFTEKMSDAWGTAWEETKKKAIEKKETGFFDHVFFTQIYPDNFYNYAGTIRSTIFNGYPNPVTVPVTPLIVLTDQEIGNVTNFAQYYNLAKFKHVILFESSPGSGQSAVNNEVACTISEKIVDIFEDCIVILTSNQKITSGHPRIIDASVLTFRENAELSKHCHLLIGCSSGITWLLTSDWAKKIPTIQILKKKALFFEFASVSYDLNLWGQQTDHIIEITGFENRYIVDCVKMALEEGIEKTREKYHEKLKPSDLSLVLFIGHLIHARKFRKIMDVSNDFYKGDRDTFVILKIPFILVSATILYPLTYVYRKVKRQW